jgi:uncharacterized OB-fold protein
MKKENKTAYKCTKCGRLTYPKRSVCLKCSARTFEEVPPASEGNIVTFSQIFQLPWGINDRFLTIGICQFDNGVKAMGRITTPDVKKGTRVKAEWKIFREIQGEDAWGWVFTPVS